MSSFGLHPMLVYLFVIGVVQYPTCHIFHCIMLLPLYPPTLPFWVINCPNMANILFSCLGSIYTRIKQNTSKLQIIAKFSLIRLLCFIFSFTPWVFDPPYKTPSGKILSGVYIQLSSTSNVCSFHTYRSC